MKQTAWQNHIYFFGSLFSNMFLGISVNLHLEMSR